MAETKEFLLSQEQYHKLEDIVALYCHTSGDKSAYSILVSLQLQALDYRWV